MAFSRTHASLLLSTLLLLLFPIFSFSYAASELHNTPFSGGGGEHGLVPLRRSVAEDNAPSHVGALVDNTSFILAAYRTHREDPLNGYKHYSGGWNISDQHYWASVIFTAVDLFVIGITWFLAFGLALFLICCCYCCFPRRSYSYSRTAYALSLILLILFTCTAIIGSIVLYDGQGKFHSSSSNTLDYVVSKANLTVDNLRNFSNNLAAAKKVGVDQIFLPADVQGRIDIIETEIITSANDLATRTSENSKRIQHWLDSVRLSLIIVAAVMLLLAFLGFLFSVLGMQSLVYILVLIGWILVAGTFILCGVSLVLHNAVVDTCVAMDEWVAHPHAHTALDDILPCVDAATANESLYRSKEVTFQLVNVVNQVINNISNMNYPPDLAPLYYNQSGPLMPQLCNPYAPDMSNRTCASGEVNISNASQVWQVYICNVSVASGSEICKTVGRVTPKIYSQMTAAVSVGFGLENFGPFLVQLEDCTFVRDTFTAISHRNCRDLGLHSRWIYIGLVMVSSAIMLSLIFWVIYAWERGHRKSNKQFVVGSGHVPLQDKAP